jgi:hypothetical protein
MTSRPCWLSVCSPRSCRRLLARHDPRPFVKPWFHEQSRLNEILGDYLQYFGVIYGLLLGLLAVATYQNHTDVEKAVASEASCLLHSIGTSALILSRPAPS